MNYCRTILVNLLLSLSLGGVRAPQKKRARKPKILSQKARPARRFGCIHQGCGARPFRKKSQLTRHIQEVHSDDPYQFTCSHCFKDFKREWNLKRHLLICTSNVKK